MKQKIKKIAFTAWKMYKKTQPGNWHLSKSTKTETSLTKGGLQELLNGWVYLTS